MSPSPDLTALYGRPIILWVEDLVTSTYLDECWQDADIAFRVGGGHEGIRTVVRSAQSDGHRHIFGFVDRDLGHTNRPTWSNATASPIFVPEVHEVENYMLDASHLEACDLNNGGRSAANVATRLHTFAARMVWWMACRQVLADLRAQTVKDFPSHAVVHNQAEAELLVCSSGWYINLAGFATTITATGEITRRLTSAYATAAAELGNGQWRTTYSGKALVRELHYWLYTPPGGTTPSPAERDRDLARSVARWQRANGAIPAEVTDLRTALRTRVGI